MFLNNNEMTDSFKLKGLRNKLIQTLKSKGINNEKILNAVLKIPRHLFMPKGFEERAYQDNAFPIAAEQTISQPYTVAFQTSLLNIKKGDKVLEIGTGSGYQSAVLMELGVKLYSIERQRELFLSSQKTLRTLGYNIFSYFGDGYAGLPTYAPFDKILITAGAPEIPKELLKQLKVGGVMVAPIGTLLSQDMLRITKINDVKFKKENFGKFVFVPMLKGKN